jgi:carboxypeptidase Taq
MPPLDQGAFYDGFQGDAKMHAADAYTELSRRAKEAQTLTSAASLLSWDQETYMPDAGSELRGEQLALLAGLVHERRTDPRIGELLEKIETENAGKDPDSLEAADVREWRRLYDRAVKLPQKLVEELARVTSLAQVDWTDARKDSDWKRFAPWLDKIIALKKEEAQAIGGSGPAYDALLDEYEPGATTAALRPMFADLRARLVPFLDRLLGASRKPDASILRRHYDVETQRRFARSAAEEIGFDFNRGRIDVTTHPFCMGLSPNDVRLTTRYSADFFNDGFFSVLHEAGHGLYEQGLDPSRYGHPTGEAASLGVHETQSRLWENLVGRSASFWRRWFPKAKESFPEALQDVKPDTFHFAVNAVAPSFIRVDADEVTYNLHVMVRFEMEQALIGGDLAPADVPEVWNAKMKEYLQITPPDDRRGCLQDVHWSAGLVGYFPTYTLGNLGAAQLFAAARESLGDLDRAFEAGEYRPLLDWLRNNVHRHGLRYKPAELLRRATGKPLAADDFMASLQLKYGELYGV